MTKVHDLKCHSEPFRALADGDKRFEFRRNDRDYEVRDVLVVREWRPSEMLPASGEGDYTGAVLAFRVSYCLYGPTFGVPDGYVVMSLETL